MSPARPGRPRWRRGYTLLELLITVALAVILVTLALRVAMHALDSARASETMAALRTVSSALILYASEHGDVPGGKRRVSDLRSMLLPYASDLPTIDGWGNPLYYEFIPISANHQGQETNDGDGRSGGGTPSDKTGGRGLGVADPRDDDGDDDDAGDPHRMVGMYGDGLDPSGDGDARSPGSPGKDAPGVPGTLDPAPDGTDDFGELIIPSGNSFRVTSFGKDGAPDADVVLGVWVDFNSDTVIQGASFIQAPW